MKDTYKPIAKYYDLLSHWYSLGEISKCRNAYLKEIADAVIDNADLKVCFVGVGHGAEAIRVAELGVQVTVVDTSPSMLEAFQQNLMSAPDRVRARVKVVLDDVRIFSSNLKDSYDWVVANFFLNVFDQSGMPLILCNLLDCCDEDGALVISDFYLNRNSKGFRSSWIVSILQKLYWYSALIIFRFWVKNAIHSVYDYKDQLKLCGWQVVDKEMFGFLGIEFYQAMKCQKNKSKKFDDKNILI